MNISANSLVLYKNRPARVIRAGDKLELELEDGRNLKVRPKDVALLHPGPVRSLSELKPLTGEVKTAWELLAGQTSTLAELAELIYEAFTPATAWAAWQLVDDGLYFHGAPAAVVASTPAEVAKKQASREAKAAEERAWTEFLGRAGQGRFDAADAPFLRDVVELALGRQSGSRLLRELGRAQTPENAHALLLETGYWTYTVNPYPHRLKLPVDSPQLELPDLPPEERADLTRLPAFAIDDEGSQDPDDALSLDGNRLWVHVADAAALVTPDSPADLEARLRGAKLYLPELSVPMLPPQATGLLALGLAEVSPALSFGLELAENGEIGRVEVTPSWVRVTRLTYEEAEARLPDEPFRTLYRLAQTYEARRLAGGAVVIDLPEVKIRVAAGQVVIRPLPPLRSRDLVREAMLMAGEAMARLAMEQRIPLPFTTQEKSEVEAGLPDGLAGMYARRRLMPRSQLSGIPAPHQGLGLEVYTQLTSPLRRYLDLVMHQQVRAFLRGEPTLDAQAILERVGATESIIGSVRQAERLSNKHWTLVYLLQHPDWQGQGVVVEKREARATVLIPELDLITYLHLQDDAPLNTVLPLKVRHLQLAELEGYFQLAA
ncbi:MAG: RNB domain-containing ribonuclease [Chloroflexota bacterium]